ncbi:MAG: hypothetical protein MUC40_01715 [Akkermansiaceae bacterium]|jgi:pyruvate/2-oxoglutarate dehydrogenase complex dihydrolipoamide dehydrogenase (E3) component|nr:hypothetical protein [Akkermansiaceae bacterium]
MQRRIAAHHVAGRKGPAGIDDRLLMNVIFTDPQLAFVALTENEARAGGACGSNGYILHVDF